MRINLFSTNAAALTIHGEVPVDGDMLAAWKEVGLDYNESLWSESRHVETLSAVAGYSAGKNIHQILLSMSRHRHDDSDAAPWYLHIGYICPTVEGRTINSPPQEARENTNKIKALLDESPLSGVNADFYFDLTYSFPQDSVETIIALPLIKFNDASLPFTDIRGLRLTKETETDNEPEYEVTLNANSDNTLNLNVSFRANEPLNAQLPKILMTRANAIMSKFIIKKDSA